MVILLKRKAKSREGWWFASRHTARLKAKPCGAVFEMLQWGLFSSDLLPEMQPPALPASSGGGLLSAQGECNPEHSLLFRKKTGKTPGTLRKPHEGSADNIHRNHTSHAIQMISQEHEDTISCTAWWFAHDQNLSLQTLFNSVQRTHTHAHPDGGLFGSLRSGRRAGWGSVFPQRVDLSGCKALERT